ncbi:MAG TPA: ATP-dependent Clp protease proteolytic subunit [Elusimicrobiota bacterium]|jgi:ATP-dependent Clp protease protease subunit|nr:ATP-dependent Clp protease proteolytic subunit [Elusimicrobiota bacterium]
MPNILPTVLERWTSGSATSTDIFSRLLQERIVFFGGDEGVVTTDSANLLISQLLYLDSQDNQKDINLYINSPGGMVSAGLAVYDTMQFVRAPISTLCMGMAMSFGAVLLAAGTKGKRYILPHSRVMIHQPLIRGGGMGGQETDIRIEGREMASHRRRLSEILALHCGQPYEKVDADVERNYYMSADEAVAYGLVDQVLSVSKP